MRHINFYHVTQTKNIKSIVENGLIPSFKTGIMKNRDNKIYLTNSLKYLKIMAEDISKWDNYTILKVNIDLIFLTLIWWRGKKYKEWVIREPISTNNIQIIKEVRGIK